MIIAGRYSFNHGEDVIHQEYPQLLREVETIIESVDASVCKTKTSEEKTMIGKMLYSPHKLNQAFKHEFQEFGWTDDKMNKVYCDYPIDYYTATYQPKSTKKTRVKPYRSMDFVKDMLGVEVQLGKYAFMVYNVCAKMTIFHNLGIIDTGIEIVPIKQLANDMSTGVSYFEQFVWDLKTRGVSNIDLPVLILGIDDVS